MRSYFKNIVIFLVLSVVLAARAGSYDDFFTAIIRDNPSTIQSLLNRGFDPDTVDPKGLSGLYLALRDESLKVATVLIDWPRTNVEIRTPEDESPLMMAALKGRLEFVKKLIARGADVNKPGWTPLHYAATGGHLEIMALLLDQNAYIDAASPNGTTPLMMAAQYASADAVKLLLDAGADPSLKNQSGLTAIDFANRASREDSAELIAAAARSGRRKDKGKW
jgi:uncharacterized protein